jgi:NADP-dependent 3-hydroxy acid dehydrogenase YdfG
MLDTNVKGLLHTVRAVAPGMVARGRGDVVLIGSVAGRQVYPNGNVYCASKWAVRGIYEALRLDLPQPEIRISTVDPGLVKTDFSLVRFHGDAERAAGVYAGVEHLNPEDVADAVRYIVTRPPHVNIGELVIWASAQASTTRVQRHGLASASFRTPFCFITPPVATHPPAPPFPAGEIKQPGSRNDAEA